MNDHAFYFKPNLTDIRFIQFYGKIMMIVKVLPLNSKLNFSDWKEVKKILYLSENIDLSLPQFGLLTNGIEWIIRDFKNRKWLKTIPTRKDLMARLHLRSFIVLKIIQYVKNYYRLFKFPELIPFFSIKENLKALFDNLEKILRKILKSPQPQLFN